MASVHAQQPPPLNRTPLPPNPYDPETQPAWYTAYQTAVDHQNTRSFNSALLGYTLLEALHTGGRDDIADDINKCNNDANALGALAESYVSSIVRPFIQNKGRTPLVHRPHNDNHSYNHIFYNMQITESPSHRPDWLRDETLRREGNRCIVSGVYNMWIRPGTHGVPFNADSRFLELSHIFSPSTNQNLGNADKLRYAMNVWTVIRIFAGIDVLNELNGGHVHSFKNVMMLELNLHRSFDNLLLWFEEIPGVENTYVLRTTTETPQVLAGLPPAVTFTTTTTLPLPDARYLKIHAAACRIAHLSGAAEALGLFMDLDGGDSGGAPLVPEGPLLESGLGLDDSDAITCEDDLIRGDPVQAMEVRA